MKRMTALLLLLLVLSGCGNPSAPDAADPTADTPADTAADTSASAVQIVLGDAGITVDGQAATADAANAVYIANDIVYYPTGQDHTFGEGSAADAHEAAEAVGHTVVHITQPGTYALSGKLSAGQIAVDLGEGAEDDPNAVVTLVLNGVDITCTVAPAIIFYQVYECGSTDAPSAEVDTSAAGANVLLADGSVNHVTGSYVARIYKPGTVELNEDGSEVLDAKKLHKYDAAFYSKMSMNVGGSGTLIIDAENEGLDSELHLTINGGDIRIFSGNDGINTNEDGVSVTTINGGQLSIQVTGETGEGDGIDSNGWLVINGGTVTAAACSFSGDAGIDSDMGIHLNGGTVIATGHMLDQIAGSDLTYAVCSFAATQSGGSSYILKDAAGNPVMACTPTNDFSILILASDALQPGAYTFFCGETQLSAISSQGFGGPGSMMSPGGFTRPEGEGMTPPEGFTFPEGEGMTPPEGFTPPEGEGMTPPEGELPQTAPNAPGRPGRGQGQSAMTGDASPIITLVAGGNYFSLVTPAQA